MKQIEWIKVIRDMSPRVHCITNYVTAGDVANMVLAIGGSPIMAQGIREVEDVTSICQSLVLNMGTLEEERVEAMILAGKKAVQLGHPVILDPVGVTASAFRRESAPVSYTHLDVYKRQDHILLPGGIFLFLPGF